MPLQPYTRLQHPDASVNRIIQDIYDKLDQTAVALTRATTASAPVSTVTPIISITGGGGGSPSVPSASGIVFLEDTSARILLYPPANYPLGSFYYASDTSVIYVDVINSIGVRAWTRLDLSTIISDTHANRIANYPASSYSVAPYPDVFFETDTQVFLVNEVVGGVNTWVPTWAYPLADTRANMNNAYFSAWWPQGQIYEQTDSYLEYISQPTVIASCTITGGTTIGYSGVGTPFDSRLVGYKVIVTISTVEYPVQVTGAFGTVLTIATSLSNSGCTVTIIGGQWVYQSGIYMNTYASRPVPVLQDFGLKFLATDLGWLEVLQYTAVVMGVPVLAYVYESGQAEGTVADMLALNMGTQESFNGPRPKYAETDFGHVHEWTGSAWQFAMGEVNNYMVESSSASAPGGAPTTATSTTNGWYPCDGGTYSVVNGDGSTTSVTTEDRNSSATVAAIMTGGFNASLNPATVPTYELTEATTTELQSAVVVQSGTGASVAGASHTHNFAIASADTPINPPSVANGGLPQYFTGSWWLRA